jgi:hypothetical protein
MKERIRCFSKASRRNRDQEFCTKLELAAARGNLTRGSYRSPRPGLMEREKKSGSYNSNGQRIGLTSFSTIEERLHFDSKEIPALLKHFDATPATAEDIEKRSEYEVRRAKRYIAHGSEQLTMGMRIFALKKGLKLPKAVMRHTR